MENTQDTSKNLYNVQVITIRLDGMNFYFVTVRQDERDVEEIWSSRNDGEAPVYDMMKRAGKANITVHTSHRGVTQAQGKKQQSIILAGFDSAYGESRVLNVKAPKLKVI